MNIILKFCGSHHPNSYCILISGEIILTSSFVPFQSTVDGICEHLITLQQSRFSSELYDRIQGLEDSQYELAMKVTKSLGVPLSEIEVDDFKGWITF